MYIFSSIPWILGILILMLTKFWKKIDFVVDEQIYHCIKLYNIVGAHTIGKARCTIFRDRIYNETNIDRSFAKARQSKCPRNSGDNNLANLDVTTPNSFDNDYYKNLLNQKGLLHSDQILFNGGSSDSLVKRYSRKPNKFYSDFVTAMIKMGDIDPLTGSKGEIRKHCARAN